MPLWRPDESFTVQSMCSLYKHTFTKTDVFLQEVKINFSMGFLFLCVCFNSSESQNMTQSHSSMHRWMVNMQLWLFWGGCCLTRVFSAESWSITMQLYISLSQCSRQGGCWEQLSLAGRKHKSRDLEYRAGQCWAGACFCNNGEPWQAPAPARLLLPAGPGAAHVDKKA